MRTISKTFGGTITVATVGVIEGGKPMFVEKRIAGKKSMRAVTARMKSELGTSNFLVKDVRHEVTDNPVTYSVDGDTFFANSETCAVNTTYGHDTVVVGFKLTIATWYDGDFTEHQYVMLGTTTQNKLRNAIADAEKREDVLVGEVKVITQKRWMPKDTFIMLATEGESEDESA